MSSENGQHDELMQLLEALCENRLQGDDVERFEEIVLGDPAARDLYLAYVDLHGSLYWDTARGVDEAEVREPGVSGVAPGRSRRRSTVVIAAVAVAALLLLVLGVTARPLMNIFPATAESVVETETGPSSSTVASQDGAEDRAGAPVTVAIEDGNDSASSKTISSPTPPTLANRVVPRKASVKPPRIPPVVENAGSAGSVSAIVKAIDQQIEAGWSDNEITPSRRASDPEWLRRVYLDLVGHIPAVEDVIVFLKDRNPDKRSAVVDRLLDDPDFVGHWSTTWTNLLIGRSEQTDVDRDMLARFFRHSLTRNRPWNEVVFELVSAEGRNDTNGATNFLLAHLNNDASPATAITARLFLGTQVQCTQCHNHPFNKWQQQQFHDLNVFFKATHKKSLRGESAVELVSELTTGEGFYEDRQGVLHVSRPRYRGVDVAGEKEVNLRAELARLMTDGRDPRLARAMVNRVWAHFLGRGFTAPIDDMGPHNPPTHPELLERLASEFTASSFDLKQLIRWVCHSRVYHLSSRFAAKNLVDDPDAGAPALFSRVYVKPMTVEQLYDSLLVATNVDRAAGDDWEMIAATRRKWLGQFVHAFGTDENDEITTFEGTISQALMMMNGDMVREALQPDPGSYLHDVVTDRGSDVDKVKKLCLSALGRFPTREEMRAIQEMLPLRPAAESRNSAPPEPLVQGLQDVFWAYLNSNEFIVVP